MLHTGLPWILMVPLWHNVILMGFTIVLRFYFEQANDTHILLIVVWHLGYTLAFLLRRSGIYLDSSLLSLRKMVIVLNVEFGWLFHSIVLDLISLCRKSLQSLHLSRALIAFHSDMMDKFPQSMCLLNAFSTKDYLTSHTKFMVLRALKASLTLLYRFDLFPISFGLSIILVSSITEVDRMMVELPLALGVMLGSIANLACEFEATSIAHEIAHLLARRAFVFLLLVLFGSLDQAAFLFGVVERILGLVVSIHIRKY